MLKLKILTNCFSPLGERPKDLPDAFSMHLFYKWRAPMMCPIFAINGVMTIKNIRELEEYFDQNPAKFRFEWNDPYFCILDDEKLYNIGKIREIAEKEGYKEYEKDVHFLNYFSKPREALIPQGFTIHESDFFGELQNDFDHVLTACFDEDADSLEQVHNGVERVAGERKIVVIRDENEKPAAAASMFIKDEYAYFFGTGVLPKYRKIGLWKALIYNCQLISKELGAKHYIYLTTEPSIQQYGDLSLKIITFVKD